MDPMLISIAAFLGAGGLVAAVWMLLQESSTSSVEERLDVLAGKKSGAKAESHQVTKETLFQEGLQGVAGSLQNLVGRFENMRLLFVQADSPIRPETFFLLSGACALLGVGVSYVARAPIPLYPLSALVFGLLPLAWMWMRRRSRFKKFARQLPDALELIARALRSGHSLASGLHVVVEEMPEPIAREFAHAYEEQNLGVPIDQALKSACQRMPNMDFRFFVTAVAIQRQSGGDLAELLDKIGYIIRSRFKIMGQVQALTGEGRISGIVLMALPIALFFAVWHLNPEYMMLLFTDDLGRKMVAVAAVLQVLGAIAIKKIVAIKV